MRYPSQLLMSAFLAGATVFGPTASSQSEANGLGPDVLEANARTIEFLEARMETLHIPGLQVAVVLDERIVLSEALGFANVEHEVPVERDTLFSINSATKCFTGVALMQLVEDGKVDLEARIGDYLAELPEAWRQVRVRQLLAHTSGLPDIDQNDELIGGGGEAEAWAAVQALPMQSEPGTGFSYNQTNYLLLARIIEARAGMSFTDFFGTRQFEPAGMQWTCFGDTFDVLPGAASAYSYYRRLRGEGPKKQATLSRWVDDLPPFMRTAAGINSTAGELAGWLIALRSGKLLGNPTSLETMWTADTLNDGSQNQWAMGWPILRAAGPHRIVGGTGGARSAFFVYPEDDLAIVVLTNLVGSNPQAFIDEIAAFYVRR